MSPKNRLIKNSLHTSCSTVVGVVVGVVVVMMVGRCPPQESQTRCGDYITHGSCGMGWCDETFEIKCCCLGLCLRLFKPVPCTGYGFHWLALFERHYFHGFVDPNPTSPGGGGVQGVHHIHRELCVGLVQHQLTDPGAALHELFHGRRVVAHHVDRRVEGREQLAGPQCRQ